MSYLLNATQIKAPNSMEELNSTQRAEHRALNGTVSRDLFGDNKRVWRLRYENCQKADFDTINTQYQAYLTANAPITFQSDESNYTISATNVHVDLLERNFTEKGSSYLSDFDLILKEA